MGNLSNYLNIEDLKELFGLEATKYLKENCSITIPINRKKQRYCIPIVSKAMFIMNSLNLVALNSSSVKWSHLGQLLSNK